MNYEQNESGTLMKKRNRLYVVTVLGAALVALLAIIALGMLGVARTAVSELNSLEEENAQLRMALTYAADEVIAQQAQIADLQSQYNALQAAIPAEPTTPPQGSTEAAAEPAQGDYSITDEEFWDEAQETAREKGRQAAEAVNDFFAGLLGE